MGEFGNFLKKLAIGFGLMAGGGIIALFSFFMNTSRIMSGKQPSVLLGILVLIGIITGFVGLLWLGTSLRRK